MMPVQDNGRYSVQFTTLADRPLKARPSAQRNDSGNGGPPSGHPAASSGFDGMDDDITF